MTFSVLSEDEVYWKYKRAENKDHMIGVIADLTCATKKEVMEFLGVKPREKLPGKKDTSTGNAFATKVTTEQVLRLKNVGLSHREIAQKLRVSPKTVRRHMAKAEREVQRHEAQPNAG